MTVVTERAVVLKSTAYKDSDKIYTFFSESSGKFSAFGKGVRSIKSRRNGNLDTLNLVDVTYKKTPNDHKYINEVASVHAFSNLKADLTKSASGYYFSELVYKLYEEGEPQQELFDLLVHSLELLDEGTFDVDLVETYFEINLLGGLGYSLILDSCVYCGRTLTQLFSLSSGSDVAGGAGNTGVRLDFGAGGVVCDKCFNGPGIGGLDVAPGFSKGRISLGSGIRLSKKDVYLLASLSKGVFPSRESNLNVSFDSKNILKLHFAEVVDIEPKTFSFFTHISKSY